MLNRRIIQRVIALLVMPAALICVLGLVGASINGGPAVIEYVDDGDAFVSCPKGAGPPLAWVYGYQIRTATGVSIGYHNFFIIPIWHLVLYVLAFMSAVFWCLVELFLLIVPKSPLTNRP